MYIILQALMDPLVSCDLAEIVSKWFCHHFGAAQTVSRAPLLALDVIDERLEGHVEHGWTQSVTRKNPVDEREDVRLPLLGHHGPLQLGVQVHDVLDLSRWYMIESHAVLYEQMWNAPICIF